MTDNDRPDNIIIVGAGISGLTAAAALGLRGIGSRIYERAERFAPVGAGIQLAPNATMQLRRLGIGPILDEVGIQPQSIDLQRWDDGTVIGRTELGARCRARHGAPYLTLHRADLIDALVAAAGPARINLGHELASINVDADQVDVRFVNRPSTSGKLVVGADGIRSTVREYLIEDAATYSGHAIFRGVVPASHAPELVADPRVRIWLGPDQHAVCYPVSAGRALSFAATVKADRWDGESWTTVGDPEEMMAAYHGWDGRLLKVLGAANVVGQWALHDRDPVTTWSSDRMVVIGDAAHPMLPFMAQGANQAIEDAVALAACLSGETDPGRLYALRHFESVRLARTTLVQERSRRNRERLHLGDGREQERRDAGLVHESSIEEHDWLYGYDAANVTGQSDTLAVASLR